MRRGVVLVIIGAVVLGLVVTVAVLVGVVLPRLRRDPGPPPSYAPGELTPEESTVVAKPQEDGTVRVIQLLTFDAGPGTDRPLTFYLGGTRLGRSATARYAVLPQVRDAEAEADTPGNDGPLTIEMEETAYADPFTDGRRYAVSVPGGWSSGRHRVTFQFVLSDVWVEIEGERVLVLPLRFVSGPDTGQPADQVRLNVNGAARLDCPDSNELFADRQTCGEDDVLNYRPAELRSTEAVTIPDPGFITAAPVPVTERAR